MRQPGSEGCLFRSLKRAKNFIEGLIQDYFETFFKKGKLNNKELSSKVAFVMVFMEGAFLLSITAQEIMPDNWAADELLARLID